eukprot:1183737-Amphidinium_carterae.1
MTPWNPPRDSEAPKHQNRSRIVDKDLAEDHVCKIEVERYGGASGTVGCHYYTENGTAIETYDYEASMHSVPVLTSIDKNTQQQSKCNLMMLTSVPNEETIQMISVLFRQGALKKQQNVSQSMLSEVAWHINNTVPSQFSSTMHRVFLANSCTTKYFASKMTTHDS